MLPRLTVLLTAAQLSMSVPRASCHMNVFTQWMVFFVFSEESEDDSAMLEKALGVGEMSGKNGDARQTSEP